MFISQFPENVIEVDKRIRVQKLLLRDKIFKSLWLKCSVTNVHNMYISCTICTGYYSKKPVMDVHNISGYI